MERLFTEFDVAVDGVEHIADKITGTGGALDDVLELFRCHRISQLRLNGKTGAETPQIVEAIPINQACHLIGKNGIKC